MTEKLLAFAKKYFSRAPFFKKYEGITPERYNELVLFTKDYLKKHEYCDQEALMTFFYGRYSAGRNPEELSFDEVCICLILMCDPNCEVYDKYVKSDIKSKDYIEKIEDERLAAYYKNQRDVKIKEVQNLCRDKFTVYNALLVTLERYYYQKFIKSNNLPISFASDNFISLMDNVPNDISFDVISFEKYEELVEKAKQWVATYDLNKKHLLLANHMAAQPEFFDVNDDLEKLIMMVLVTDPNLELLEEYYDSSNWNDIKRVSHSKLGFFHKNFALVEKKYNEKFINRKFGPWDDKTLHIV